MLNNIPYPLLNDKQKIIYIINLLLAQIKVLQQNIPTNKKILSSDLDKITLSYLFHELGHPEELLLIFDPITLKIWFNIFFKNKKYIPKSNIGRPPTHVIIKKIICELKFNNNPWGYTRILDELKKLKIRVCRNTVKNIIKKDFPDFVKQNTRWKRFLENQYKKHIYKVISCDFKKTFDSNGNSLFILFFMALSTKEILHANVTHNPNQHWIHQQLRELSNLIDLNSFCLIRDNDALFKNIDFDQFNIKQIRISKRSPEKNAVMERFIGSFQREALFYFKEQLDFNSANDINKTYIKYYNNFRPHQGLDGLTIPEYKKQLLQKLDNSNSFNTSKTDESFLFYDLKEHNMLYGLLNHYYFGNLNVA